MKPLSILLKTCLLALCFLVAGKVCAQKKIETGPGVGVPEYTNLKIKYGRNFQAGISVHYWYYSEGGIFNAYSSWSLAAEFYYHFAGKSQFTTQRPFYIVAGAGYYHCDYLVDTRHEEYSSGFYPRIGRTFNISEKMGITLDAGLFLPFSVHEDYEPYRFRLLPSGNLSYFIRL
jgi:hypothetical protein